MVDRCMRNSSPREAERKKENEKNNWCGRNRNFQSKSLGRGSRGKWKLEYRGYGVPSQRWYAQGEIVDFRKAAAAVHAALEEAEKMSGTTVDSVYLAQTGSHLKGQMLRGSSSIAASDNRVVLDDLKRASAEAKLRQPAQGRTYVHHVRTPIILDDKIVEDPVGMIGKKIDLGYWAIDGDDQAIRSSLHVISNYSLEVDDLILSSIASGTMVAGPDLRRAGTLVIDMGAGVTDLVLYRQGFVAFTGVVPVGGDHVTGDLSMGLRVHEPYAEKLKIEHGRAMPSEIEEDDDLWVIGNKTIGDRAIPRKAISRSYTYA